MFLFIFFAVVSVEAEELKVIEPEIGYTPDISVNAKQNLTMLKRQVDSVVNSYPDYTTAIYHLNETQIFIYENFEEFSSGDHLYVGTVGCSWYCGGGPDEITASSVLPPSNNLDYVPENIHDFSLRTAWVEGKAGYGIGESITFRFAKNSPPVTAVEIFNGYMKSDILWQANSRVKQLKLYIDDKPYAILNLKDIKSKQIFNIDTLQGTENDLFLKFEIVDVYKGDKYDDVAISEIEFDGTGVHCFAEGTMISTPDGSVEIEKLTIGSKVLSYNEQTKEIETSTIRELSAVEHDNLYELDFTGTIIIVTDDHPFYHNGHYYSVVENKKYGIQTKQLIQGQAISFLANGHLKDVGLTKMKKLDNRQMTYTITRLDRNRLFFANGACVAIE